MNTTAKPETAKSTPLTIWLESASCLRLFRNAASANVVPAHAQNLYPMVTPRSENTSAPSVYMSGGISSGLYVWGRRGRRREGQRGTFWRSFEIGHRGKCEGSRACGRCVGRRGTYRSDVRLNRIRIARVVRELALGEHHLDSRALALLSEKPLDQSVLAPWRVSVSPRRVGHSGARGARRHADAGSHG